VEFEGLSGPLHEDLALVSEYFSEAPPAAASYLRSRIDSPAMPEHQLRDTLFLLPPAFGDFLTFDERRWNKDHPDIPAYHISVPGYKHLLNIYRTNPPPPVPEGSTKGSGGLRIDRTRREPPVVEPPSKKRGQLNSLPVETAKTNVRSSQTSVSVKVGNSGGIPSRSNVRVALPLLLPLLLVQHRLYL
jgi:hypothetical protein